MTEKTFIKALILAVIPIFLTAAGAFAGITSLPGVPSDTPFFMHIELSPEHQSALAKLIDTLKGEKDFQAYLEAFKKKTGSEFPEKIFESVKKIKSFTLSVFLNLKDFKRPPDVLLNAGFAGAEDAAGFAAELKRVMVLTSKYHAKELVLPYEKEITFTDAMVDGVKMSSPSIQFEEEEEEYKEHVFKDFEPRVFEYKNFSGFFIYQKYDPARTEKIVKSAAQALKSDKTALSNKQIKADMDKIGADANLFLYIEGAVNRQGALENGSMAEADYLSSVSFASVLSPDFVNSFTKWVINLKDLKDRNAYEKSNIIKALISGGVKGASHISSILPADTAAFINFNFDIGDKVLKLAKPMIDAEKPVVAMMFGLSVEEDLLSWLSGELFFATLADSPHFCMGLGSKSQDAVWKFFDKFEKVLKLAGSPFDFKSDTIAGVQVKTSAVAGMDKYIKNFSLVIGHTGRFLIISSGKETFEKFYNASAGKQATLSNDEEFKKVIEWPASSFMNFYMNFDKFKFAVNDLAAKNSQEFSGRHINKFINVYAMHASYDKKSISGGASIKASPVKFVLDMLDQITTSPAVKEAVESIKGRVK